jgi:hypothetical protein
VSLVHPIILAGLAVVGGAGVASDENKSSLAEPLKRAIADITERSVLRHANALCHTDMSGREAGSAGARRAGEYIARQFRQFGLRPGGSAGSYFQSFKIERGYQVRSRLVVTTANGSRELAKGSDYMPAYFSEEPTELSLNCVFAGYGVSSSQLRFDDYKTVDAKDRAVLVFSGVPWTQEAGSWLQRVDPIDHGSLEVKAQNAANRGAKLLLVADNPTGWRPRLGMTEQLRLPDPRFPLKTPIPVVHVTREVACRLLGAKDAQALQALADRIVRDRESASRECSGCHLVYSARITGRATIGRNVIGILPGRDPALRAEAIVIGAHYDHLGQDNEDIYFGANDNASGVSALLEIARTMAELRERPDRSIVFVSFSAEEIGKLGSKHYVRSPPLPIEQTRLMINFDMIGRNEADHVFAVGTRSSPELHRMHQEISDHVDLRLSHPENMRLGRSDHSPFFYARVPVMYLFGGKHEGYHTPEDTVDKLVPLKIVRVARLAFLTAHKAASPESRLLFDRVGNEAK